MASILSTPKAARYATRTGLLLLVVGAFVLTTLKLGALEFFWESPRPIAEGQGRYPVLLQVGGDLLALWQESEGGSTTQAEIPGQAWLSAARYAGGAWEIHRRFAGPYAFRGSEPSIFSAASQGKTVIVAAADGDGKIALNLSTDGGKSFSAAASPAPSSAAVAPRVFVSASGGFILFATQGNPESKTDTLTLSYSTSPDGLKWEAFVPFIKDTEGLTLNFLPQAARLPGAPGNTDIVVFQSLLTTTSRPTFQLFAKTSADGGKTWSQARRLTTFLALQGENQEGPDAYDNQRPSLGMAGGRLWLAWERKPLGSVAKIYVAPFTQEGLLASKEMERSSSESGACAAPQVLEIQGRPATLWFDNRERANRVYLAVQDKGSWVETDLSQGKGGAASFGRAAVSEGKTYVVWQSTQASGDRITLLEPDKTVAAPGLSPENFTEGKRTRSELANVTVSLPPDSSGIAGFSYLWSRDPGAQPPHERAYSPDEGRLRLQAPEDGAWYLAVACVDNAGNWSATRRLRFVRDRTPPTPPVLIPADLDDSGFLASSSFKVSWFTPENKDGSPVDDVAGYTWNLRYIGGLEAPGAGAKASKAPSPRPGMPGLSAYEASLVGAAGPSTPPATILGTQPEVSFRNVDDGYYLFSVAAIDTTGNIGDTSTILIRSNKYIPYTTVTYAEARRDDFGRTAIKITGKGFTAEGLVERVVLDRDGREPYDLDGLRQSGGFRINSDREISDLAFEDLPAGSYRLGIYHPKRGWYWTGPIVQLDVSGTLKFGETPPPYTPSWKLMTPKAFALSIYDLIVILALLFSGLGIVLLSRQAIAAARDAQTIQQEVLALLTGGSMPTAVKAQEAQKLRGRGAGLRLKVTLTIASLVVFVVVLVAVSLGVFMIQSESTTLAEGLQQRALVLLESVTQGGRSYLPQEDILQLGFLPQQAQAMKDAVYLTVTGYASGKSTDADVVWSTNDPDILKKIDTATFQPGISRLKDDLSPKIPSIMKEINTAAEAKVGKIAEALTALNQEGQALAIKTDAASQKRLAEITASSRSYEKTITESLFELSNQSVGSNPGFDRQAAAMRQGTYVFYKPILYRRGQDKLYYRGMVRLEITTQEIVRTVRAETNTLVLRTAFFAAIALALGVIGAFILSSIIVVPIKRVVKAVERIRDTEDKGKLKDLSIQVSSHDEIRTLADTINEMTEGLVRAAEASKELLIGKGIQKMFIPLDPTPDGGGKLSTGHRDEKDFEVFGYYEGADEVSGDYWDFQSINSRYHYFIKCDVSGHGVSAALIMVQVATMVVNYFNAWKTAMPKQIDLTDLAYKINDFLYERKFKGRFAAFTLGLWDSEAGVAYLCDAGDKLLHVWVEREGRLVEEALPESPAAGPLDSFLIQMNPKASFRQVTRKLERGDVLFLYTDGIDEANHHFHDPEGNPKGDPALSEDLGYHRICAILEALHRKEAYRLERLDIPDPVLTFDFSKAQDSLEEKILALVAVEKIFRMYRASGTTDKDQIIVDAKVDDFLRKKRYFDQVRLFLGPDNPDGTNPNVVAQDDPGYVAYRGLREDPQDDDLTFLGIRRK